MNDMRQMTSLGREIEDKSFSIIDEEAGPHPFSKEEWEVVRRIIHATADFEYKDITKIHYQAIDSGIQALKKGCPIVCDVQMILAGLNQDRLKAYGCKTFCFISDKDVITKAKEKNSTRAIEAIQKAKASNLLNGAVIIVGNAPTALLEIERLIRLEGIKPALIIGVPVGFVSAVESKEVILKLEYSNAFSVPYILTKGRKGGSTIAVAILHALLLLSSKRGEK
ncbi:cobalt-precorrin-8 methylmutase [Leptospira borgpetersenii]|uniref:Precorrin-8X methylmutase n=1 Tax=Leptospira borgpetersenii serovar Javanica str. UI 09931 TaxID=1049767 RepID=A0AAV3J683_LEPBO|nr:cobalt-precorrin-8 methylmutase [Leptospira borgpetersenii]AXX17448.1 precorrin-8X methylmutase [Leptospira borgpetersenii serovar Ceylonica]EKQ90524.1 precorrin-8X methylmutase [Leptospira borgpetersenii str. UI 09149]EMN59750.1 precorrin-8X methylmutase [Leptospira borgpetersenii serovar Javanica str. MK146]EPG56171.1 precorrin-8X methylmutase [Leptospira borgpetersenii serovar Javanica str. UI 09931]MDQ7245081.1 cobalt-precorrin-8 methylmutase [Leptospira borgpetersenii]